MAIEINEQAIKERMYGWFSMNGISLTEENVKIFKGGAVLATDLVMEEVNRHLKPVTKTVYRESSKNDITNLWGIL